MTTYLEGKLGIGTEEFLDLPFTSFPQKSLFALDIGSTLIKVIYTTDEAGPVTRLHFLSYPNTQINDVIDLLKSKLKDGLQKGIGIHTCGAAVQSHKNILDEELDVSIINNSEFDCFVAGFNFILKNLLLNAIIHAESQIIKDHVTKWMNMLMVTVDAITKSSEDPANELNLDQQGKILASNKPNEAATETVKSMGAGEIATLEASDVIDRKPTQSYPDDRSTTENTAISPGHDKKDGEIKYPVLLGILGSAFSMFKLESDGSYKLLDVTSTGGRTFLGMGRLLTGAKSFEELVDLASRGDPDSVHTLGKHIKDGFSGEFYIAMPDDLLTFCFGQAADRDLDSFRKEDLAAALLSTMSQDFTRTCNLLAISHNITDIYLCGSFPGLSTFVRDEVGKWLAFKCQMNSEMMKCRYHFLKFGGYYGAIGALLKTLQTQK